MKESEIKRLPENAKSLQGDCEHNSQLIEVVKLLRKDGNGYIVRRDRKDLRALLINECEGFLQYDFPGESITFVLLEMTEETYCNLPEFDGW